MLRETLEIGLPLLAAIAQAIAAVLGAIVTISPPSDKARSGYVVGFAVCGVVGVLAVGLTAWDQSNERKRPERDWVYLNPSSFETGNDWVALTTVSTGTLRNVRIAIRRIGSDGNPERGYIYSDGINGVTVDRGQHLSGITLPPGAYDIDLDPSTEFGKVSQRLSMTRTADQIAFSILVSRKNGGEVLIPPPPATRPDPQIVVGGALLILFTGLGLPASAFSGFGAGERLEWQL